MKMRASMPVFLNLLLCLFLVLPAQALTLTNPIVFVTQPPIPHENNGTVSTSFLSVVTQFGNQLSDTAHAARGGDLWLMTTNLGLVNLTRKAGFGAAGIQHGIGIDVRDPAIHWSGKKVIFSMVDGAPLTATDTNIFYWQLYELTNLDAVIANTNTPPVVVRVANQPANFNNITPCYATDGRIIFTSDRPYNNQSWLYPQRDEYKGAPSVTGLYSLDALSGDLKMIEHQPSGVFNPTIDSFGRLIVTRWDHLVQDGNASGDRLSRTTNGSFNFLSEAANATTQSTNIIESFPEPVDFDTNYAAQLGVNVDGFNLFLPWALDQAGGNEEVLNHVGRHELQTSVLQSFTGDTNLVTFTNLAQRVASGVISANTNGIFSFMQIIEDPRTNGLYWGVQAQDISPVGGLHTSGQIITLTGGLGLNPTNMVVTSITPTNGANGPTILGLYRNPLPMSDGTLVSVFSDSANGGWDSNIGSASTPVSKFHFRLYTLANTGTTWATNQSLTTGIAGSPVYWDGATLVTNSATMWELQPVEVRARTIPAPFVSTVNPIEQQVFADEQVDLPTFQADLVTRNLALVISRNVTARDDADKQQPYNLSVPGGVSTVANSGKVYGITHLQYLEADYLRGYNLGAATNQPGRRVLAMPIASLSNLNYNSTQSNAPLGGTQIMSDGSQAAFIPANRAVTWQLTGTNNNDSVVKERYWINFRPGEVRTCANCHGINAVDQVGRSSPTNSPFALRQLLRLWRTNSANAYLLTVSNGAGSGAFGAGSILTLTANTAPHGKYFTGWQGPGIASPTAMTTSFIMPTTNANVVATFGSLPSLAFTTTKITTGSTNFVLTAQALANQSWVLQSSTDLVTWMDVVTNQSSVSGVLQFTNSSGADAGTKFFRIRSP